MFMGKMKAVKILGILVFVMFMVTALKDAVPGFIDGWNEAGDSREYIGEKGTYTTDFSVKAKSVAEDSLLNKTFDKKVPYSVACIHTVVKTPSWYTMYQCCTVPFIILCIYGIYCLVRVVFSAIRGDVFTRKNVKRMRYFIYSVILLGVCMEGGNYFLYSDWTSQILLEGYEVESYSIKYPWMMFSILALFIEIFAVGVKLKEEQELTI